MMAFSQQQQQQPSPPLPAADPPTVLAAVRACSSPDAAVRCPAEKALKSWEERSGREPTGYLPSLIAVVESDEISRLLAAILLKNGISKAFSVPLDDNDSAGAGAWGSNDPLATDTASMEALRNERANVRSRLPVLLFAVNNDAVPITNDITALHLQLALSNVALFDFPKVWPTLLDDLASVADGSSPLNEQARQLQQQRGTQQSPGMPRFSADETLRIRAVGALRLCLQSIRQSKLIVQKPKGRGGGRGGPGAAMMMAMGGLGKLIHHAVADRKKMHQLACGAFESLAGGIVRHAEAAVGRSRVGSGASTGSSWRGDAKLAAGYVKCMTELLPMLEIEDFATDPRVAPARDMLGSVARIADATKAYPMALDAAGGVVSADDNESYAAAMDKIHRAALSCCSVAVRAQSRLFASHLSLVLSCAAEPLMTLEGDAIRSLPPKRLVRTTAFLQAALRCPSYDTSKKDGLGGPKNAVLAALMGGGGGAAGENDDPGIAQARLTVVALLSEGTIEPLVDSIVGKLVRLHPDELEEWEDDPEGRYETDIAERVTQESETPRHCGGALLGALMNREADRASNALLDLTRRVRLQPDDGTGNGMLGREACYRALEMCRSAMVADGSGKRRLNFAEWWEAELRPMLQTDLPENSPVPMRAMQARAVQVLQAYASSLREEDFEDAFSSVTRLVAAPDLVTSLCAATCLNVLALMHVRGTEESSQLVKVREHSVTALGNTFALARRASSEECLRVTLLCVSGLVEANGVYLEPVLHAIAEQLPPLWERAGDSVTIHSCLVSVLNHLIMKMGYATVENSHVQLVLFNLLDYCTDISQNNRAETLLEDGLKLWLVTLVSSRLATMGQSLKNMLPRLGMILRAGLEPNLSLKVLQFNAILLGPEVVEPLAEPLRELLLNITSSVANVGVKGEGGCNNAMEDEGAAPKDTDKSGGTMRECVAALAFADALLQLFPDLGFSICAPAISKVVASLAVPGRVVQAQLMEAAFGAFGRMLWIRQACLEELFVQDPQRDEKIRKLVTMWIQLVSQTPMMVLLTSHAKTAMFIDQKGTAIALCRTLFQCPNVARLVGDVVLKFTRTLVEVEARSELNLDALVEAACGTTRTVVGDGPLGDSAAKTAELVKNDPMLTVNLKEALEGAEKAVANLSTVNTIQL